MGMKIQWCRRVALVGLVLGLLGGTARGGWLAGTARVGITPDYPVLLSGYAARQAATNEAGMAIHTRALALADGKGSTGVVMVVETCALPKGFRDRVVGRIAAEHKVGSSRIAILSTHTHYAPFVEGSIPWMFGRDFTPEEAGAIRRYTGELEDRVVEAAGKALRGMRPATLEWSQGSVGFAANRRTPGGPVDHSLPAVVCRDAEGKVVGLWAKYSCHCTGMAGNYSKIHGDWAGLAMAAVEAGHGGAVALVGIGCGADANPHPRGELALSEKYGAAMAAELEGMLAKKGEAIEARLAVAERVVELPFQEIPDKAGWEAKAKEGGIVGFHARKQLEKLGRGEAIPDSIPYLIQRWRLGGGTEVVFLPGEVVVDYQLAIAERLGAPRLMAHGYANYVPCYIPSRRILAEGGYEAESSLWYYDQPTRIAPEAEELILRTVEGLRPGAE